MHALSEFTTLRLGGPPRHLVEAGDEDALVRAVRQADVEHSPVLVFGGGSNIVVADDGFPGTVVRVLSSGVYKHREGDSWILHVQAGESWDALVSRSVRAGLAGFECLSGIPGSVGATPIQNVGAYGQEVSETIVSVRVYDREQDVVCELNPLECEFAYRASIFKRTPSRWVVLGVTFSLPEQPHSRPIRYTELARALQVRVGDSAPLGSVREAVLALRRSKGMVLSEDDPDTRSVGSFFVNPTFSSEEFERLVERVRIRLGAGVCPPGFATADGRVKTSSAWLIEHAGFSKGYGNPAGIAISSKHTLALINRGGGSTAQLLALAHEIADGVRSTFGIDLTPEPVFAGISWEEYVQAQ